MAIPSPNLFRDITAIGTYQHLGKILKDVFLSFFSRQYGMQIDTARSTGKYYFIPSQHWLSFLYTRTSLYVQLQQVFSVYYQPKNSKFQSRRIQPSSHTSPQALRLPTTFTHPTHPPITQQFSSPSSLVRSLHLQNIFLILSSKLKSDKSILFIISLRVLGWQ